MNAEPEEESATCWCALGALLKVTDGHTVYRIVGEEYLERVMGEPVGGFNDNHAHAEVLAAFDRAIALAEDKGR